jgi:tRNA/tmRNA/rRNA uracil-C5-methylase (TrmA/RlmC/RlmD family)
MIDRNLKPGCNPNCRTCSHREFTKEQSLAQKQNFITKTLINWDDVIYPIISVEEHKRWNYRTSVTLASMWDGENWIFGTKSFDEVIPIPNCPVHHPLVNKTIEILSSVIPPYGEFPLAFIVLSKAQCTLIVKRKEASVDWLTHSIITDLKHNGIETLWIHCNPSAGRRLFEKGGWINLFGESHSFDSNGLVYGPTSFQQQLQELYYASLNKAEDFLMPDANTVVVDLYCGTGTSLRRWRQNNVPSIGVETSGEAIECAAINARGANLLRGSCRLRIPQLTQWVLQQLFLSKQILLYTNPPRTGMELEVLEWIVKVAKPQRIAYLSCSPGTLSKNLQFLTNYRYRVKEVQPYDFFPQTHHVECLALLERQ